MLAFILQTSPKTPKSEHLFFISQHHSLFQIHLRFYLSHLSPYLGLIKHQERKKNKKTTGSPASSTLCTALVPLPKVTSGNKSTSIVKDIEQLIKMGLSSFAERWSK